MDEWSAWSWTLWWQWQGEEDSTNFCTFWTVPVIPWILSLETISMYTFLLCIIKLRSSQYQKVKNKVKDDNYELFPVLDLDFTHWFIHWTCHVPELSHWLADAACHPVQSSIILTLDRIWHLNHTPTLKSSCCQIKVLQPTPRLYHRTSDCVCSLAQHKNWTFLTLEFRLRS